MLHIEVSVCGWSSPRTRRLPSRASRLWGSASACFTRLARNGLRSTYRHTVGKCSSVHDTLGRCDPRPQRGQGL